MIPKRNEDPIGHAKFWFGPDLWEALIERAAIIRLSLHSGLVPGMAQRQALQCLRRLEQRNLLECVGRSGGRLEFILRDKAVKDHLMMVGSLRAQAGQKGGASE